jgi:hypothetical protein
VRRKVEVEAGIVLKLKASLLAIAFSTHDDEGSQEPGYFEVPAEFVGVPNLPMLGFKSFSTPGHGIDFDDALTAIEFGGVRHRDLLGADRMNARGMYN